MAITLSNLDLDIIYSSDILKEHIYCKRYFRARRW